ncbi:MAG: MBL fold metallo-hydrolase [Dehalococcoidia bacterium]
MADRLVDGIWWLHGTRGSNVYLVEAADGELVLVDCGFSTSADAIQRELAIHASGRRLSRILLTHSHLDHAGAAAVLRQRLGVRVVAGAGDVAEAEGGRVLARARGGRLLPRLRRAARGRRPMSLIPVDDVIEGEVEVAAGLLAVPVPGHTPGSYCYVDVSRDIAFVGDLVISHRDGLARPMRVTNVDDRQYLASLATFAQRAPGAGCPGHGRPVLEGFGEQLRELAALPRRSMLSPALMAQRASRLWSFGRAIGRPRR